MARWNDQVTKCQIPRNDQEFRERRWMLGGETKWRKNSVKKKFGFAVQSKKPRYNRGFMSGTGYAAEVTSSFWDA